jgi:hypothetical protein
MVEDWATMCTPSNVSESAGSACISPSQYNTSFVFLFHVAGLIGSLFLCNLRTKRDCPSRAVISMDVHCSLNMGRPFTISYQGIQRGWDRPGSSPVSGCYADQ